MHLDECLIKLELVSIIESNCLIDRVVFDRTLVCTIFLFLFRVEANRQHVYFRLTRIQIREKT